MNWLAGLNTPLREPFYATPETWRHMPDENQWMQNAIPRQGNFRSPPMEADVPVDAGRTPWIGQDVAMENALSALAWDETAGTQVMPRPAEDFLSLQDMRRLSSPVTNNNLVRQGAMHGANRMRY